ncbi:MAG: VWA domain-containing protein [Saprospiraceae bacterium]|nr:VWA domain-containing protein [Saprospiraceae bacterium]MDC3253605.1 VWA domain-containing protein [bacterium]MDG2418373.1 VWA domain-containing protein [Saprospiraceae bacterium]
MEERVRKWRLILGKDADKNNDDQVSLSPEMKGMDDVLDALYDSERQAGLGSSSPNVNRWLGDIRKYFPSSVVQLMQKDALERLNLEQMLLEPELLEAVEPDVNLVGTLLSLMKVLPRKTKSTARAVVQKVVEDLEKRLKNPLRQAIQGAINRSVRNRRPKHNEIDWNKTIRANLKTYQTEFNSIIPEVLIGHGKKGQSLKDVILLVDQSGSMANSMVYAGVFGAVMASLRSVKTHMVVFDTSVVDLTEELDDPVDLLFATQLGGGTNINKALGYSKELIRKPEDTILVLVSDLYEGGNENEMLKKVASIKKSGVQLITLLALDDQGAPQFDKSVASKFSTLGVPTFACSPDQFPSLMAAAIKKESINDWMAMEGIVGKG